MRLRTMSGAFIFISIFFNGDDDLHEDENGTDA
ncbi:hypothetical protein PMI13_01693 [Chryseobacterium populi]|uniref:Uncharacterized protein n=1 Tax=Chryseobacterium populi TaxID=1144316 RepID=J2JYN2_9FLAO|nr:hypothetical protein PMI13_01693 [Chryseobacterium populi]